MRLDAAGVLEHAREVQEVPGHETIRRCPEQAQVALTLRLVCGVATPEVAAAFLVSEATMAARLTRAKKKIAVARIPYVVPDADDLASASTRC